jgi:hypothetical protein
MNLFMEIHISWSKVHCLALAMIGTFQPNQRIHLSTLRVAGDAQTVRQTKELS